MIEFRSSIGQDSHRFETKDFSKPLILAGVRIPDIEGLEGNSDADVVFHALTNAISGISCVNILGAVSDEMCLKRSIKDSRAYLQAAIDTLDRYELVNISFSIECKRPHITPFIKQMRINIAEATKIAPDSVGITATSGEGLTGFGQGLGIQALCIVTVKREIL